MTPAEADAHIKQATGVTDIMRGESQLAGSHPSHPFVTEAKLTLDL
jgi:hypothetical protein